MHGHLDASIIRRETKSNDWNASSADGAWFHFQIRCDEGKEILILGHGVKHSQKLRGRLNLYRLPGCLVWLEKFSETSVASGVGWDGSSSNCLREARSNLLFLSVLEQLRIDTRVFWTFKHLCYFATSLLHLWFSEMWIFYNRKMILIIEKWFR